jgi:hypothetical protein
MNVGQQPGTLYWPEANGPQQPRALWWVAIIAVALVAGAGLAASALMWNDREQRAAETERLRDEISALRTLLTPAVAKAAEAKAAEPPRATVPGANEPRTTPPPGADGRLEGIKSTLDALQKDTEKNRTEMAQLQKRFGETPQAVPAPANDAVEKFSKHLDRLEGRDKAILGQLGKFESELSEMRKKVDRLPAPPVAHKPGSSLCFTDNDTQVVVQHDGTFLGSYDLVTGKRARADSGLTKDPSVARAPNQLKNAEAAAEQRFDAPEIQDALRVIAKQLRGGSILSVAVTPDGTRLAVGTTSGVSLWSITGPSAASRLLLDPHGFCAIGLDAEPPVHEGLVAQKKRAPATPDDPRNSGAATGPVELWPEKKVGPCVALTFNATGRRFAGIVNDRVMVWDVQPPGVVGEFRIGP